MDSSRVMLHADDYKVVARVGEEKEDITEDFAKKGFERG